MGAEKTGKGFSYCAVCRRNHEQGKGHRYAAGHRNALQSVLGKVRAKVESVRACLEDPLNAAGASASNRFWCVFCEEDVDDRESSIPCSSAIYHLANSSHVSNVMKFLWEHGADAKTRQEFFFSKKDIANWKALCKSVALPDSALAQSGDIDKCANNIHRERFNTGEIPSVPVEPLQNFSKDQILQVACNKGATSYRHTVAAFDGNLATVLSRPLVSSEGNVHSGAPPPWLSTVAAHESEDIRPNGMSKRKRREMERLDKRVGAAWANRRKAELARGTPLKAASSDWLPSFGRVWQNGSRRDSRKEYEMEKIREQPMNPKSPPLQPYVGKRKRLEMEMGTGAEKPET